ncbi:hypothetical protein GCM10007981_14240 [Thermocladium modestius]|uniref:2Fe-2S ferredoxin-type domain-containing protein n=1 Tax=Thermocladium modestius TaxID=62609 RepID=A0A830GWB2_9CREN|nr:(2Fe-2S)-binding protein [Thermocladium modestius]GGP21634.1 hypothetical protein GCM10007981_14240 [Thermocladium modestius]
MSEKVLVKIRVNDVEVVDEVEPRLTLLDFLRDHGYTEVHRGCDEGKCGACTVLLNGKSVKSCLVLAVQADGGSVTTVRGLSRNGELHPIQRAFLEEYAMQCGYCTHGFIMVTYDFLTNVSKEADQELLSESIKNICRCTGYSSIISAVKRASEYLRGGDSK